MGEHIIRRTASLSPALVLFVDDDEDDRLLFELALQRCLPTIEVHTFETGALLLHFLAHCPLLPDLVLLDLHMPGQDGLAIRELLQQDPQYRAVPVLIMTDSDSLQRLVDQQALRIDQVHKKPITLEGFINIVEDGLTDDLRRIRP